MSYHSWFSYCARWRPHTLSAVKPPAFRPTSSPPAAGLGFLVHTHTHTKRERNKEPTSCSMPSTKLPTAVLFSAPIKANSFICLEYVINLPRLLDYCYTHTHTHTDTHTATVLPILNKIPPQTSNLQFPSGTTHSLPRVQLQGILRLLSPHPSLSLSNLLCSGFLSCFFTPHDFCYQTRYVAVLCDSISMCPVLHAIFKCFSFSSRILYFLGFPPSSVTPWSPLFPLPSFLASSLQIP